MNDNQTFENFDWKRVSIKDQKENNITGETFWYNCYPYQRLIFFGQQGIGKTHLANAWRYKHENVRQDDFSHLFSGDFRDKMNSLTVLIDAQDLYVLFFNLQPHIMNQNYEIFQGAVYDYRELLNAEVLVIDDMGSEKSTDAMIFPQGFKKLIQDYAGKLIITTNLKIENIQKKYGMKIYSRMVEGAALLFIKGLMLQPDYRQKDL